MLQKDKTLKEMDPDLLTYVRLSAAVDTESTPTAVLAHDPSTRRTLVIDLIAEADQPAVEERLKGIQWSHLTLQYVPLHTWVSLDVPPRTFAERVQACHNAAIEHDHLLSSVVAELQQGVEDDPTWPPEVRDYVRQLQASFCSPVESTDSEESRVFSPEEQEAPLPREPNIPEESSKKEEATTETAPEQEEATTETAPEQEKATTEVAPEQEKATTEEATTETAPEQEEETTETAPEQEEATTETAPEQEEATTEVAPAPEDAPSAFVKKNKGKGKSKRV
jgi:hypothetical protein